VGEIFLKRVENDIYNRDRENTSVWERERELLLGEKRITGGERERERDLQMKERNGGEWIKKQKKKKGNFVEKSSKMGKWLLLTLVWFVLSFVFLFFWENLGVKLKYVASWIYKEKWKGKGKFVSSFVFQLKVKNKILNKLKSHIKWKIWY